MDQRRTTIWMGSRALFTFSVVAVKMATGLAVGASAADRMAARATAASGVVENKLGIGNRSPFDGTWKTDLSKTKFSPKPLTFYTSAGWYHCVSCSPAYDVQADGQDHAVSGQSYDTISVTVVDAHTISVVAKKGGAVTFEQTRTVSADGKTLAVESTGHPLSGGPSTNFETTGKRSGALPSGVHATSGNWIIQKQSGSPNALLTTYKTNGDELTMTSPTGETYTAKLDGNDYPYRGAYSYDAVSLKQINAHTIEEIDKRSGNVIDDEP